MKKRVKSKKDKDELMNGRLKMKKSVLSRLSCLAALATAFVIRAGAMTSSDYVQDGLVVHWDAIDNAGVGMHSSNTTTWVDLSGNGLDWTIDATHGRWTATGLVLDGAAQVGSMPGKTKKDFYGKLKTVEFVFANAENRDGIIFNAGFKLRAYLYTDKYGRVGFYGAKEYSCGTSVDTGMHAYSVVYGYAGSDADIPSSVSSFKVDNLQKKAETMGDYWSGSGGMSDPVIGGRSGKLGTNAKGTLSTIRIYDRVLTDEERYQNWTRDLARFMGNDSFVSDFAPTTIPRQFLAMERAACEPDFEVRSSATGEVLVKGEDYRVEFANNTSVGTATATVIALKGEYAGRKRVYEFEIFGAYRVTAAAVADSGNDGQSWNKPITLAEAMAAAKTTGYEIWLKGEVLALDASGESKYAPSKPVVLRGGFAGMETEPEQRPAGLKTELNGGSAYCPICLGNVAPNAVACERIVFRNCAGVLNKPTGTGDVSFEDCEFRQGKAGCDVLIFDGSGGTPTLRLRNCVFAENRTTSDSGALFVLRSTLYTKETVLENCLFVSNGLAFPAQVWSSVSKQGGIIQAASRLTMSGCKFVANAVSGGNANTGALIVLGDGKNGGPGAISNCVFAANESLWGDMGASYISKVGGMITVHAASASDHVDIVNCTFAYNLADGLIDPAGVNVVQGDVAIRNTVFCGGIIGQKAQEGIGRYVVMAAANASCRVDYSLFDCAQAEAVSGATVGAGNIFGKDAKFVTRPSRILAMLDANAGDHTRFRAGTESVAASVDVHERRRSPAIDMGDPTDGYSLEPSPNGKRINIGAYGNTAEAALSPEGMIMFVK